MARIKTIVEINIPVLDEDDNLVINKNGKTETEKVLFELLHWGLSLAYYENKDGVLIPSSYTVAICKHLKTGKIFTFYPTELTIIGKEIKQ